MQICDFESALMNQNHGFETAGQINDLIIKDDHVDTQKYISTLQRAIRAQKLQLKSKTLENKDLSKRLSDALHSLSESNY